MPQITFSPALSREFHPYKPDPAPLSHICSAWGVQPNEVIMVGDSLKDDVSYSFSGKMMFSSCAQPQELFCLSNQAKYMPVILITILMFM